jgi:hypothetical protein
MGGHLFRLNLSADRHSIASDDPRLADMVADNAIKDDLTESETLIVGRDFGSVTSILTGPNGNLFLVSASQAQSTRYTARPRRRSRACSSTTARHSGRWSKA